MKIKLLIPIALLLLSCSSDPEPLTFDYNSSLGVWVPYEVMFEDGTLQTTPLEANSIIGVYAESMQLNDDHTYIPIIWTDKNQYVLKVEEAGKIEFIEGNKTLVLTEGSWDMTFRIIKFSDTELWLKSIGTVGNIPAPQAQYKFKREVKH